MKTFLANYSDRIHGVVVLFRGYLPIHERMADGAVH